MQSLTPIHCFRFEIQIIKNGFTGLISYRGSVADQGGEGQGGPDPPKPFQT